MSTTSEQTYHHQGHAGPHHLRPVIHHPHRTKATTDNEAEATTIDVYSPSGDTLYTIPKSDIVHLPPDLEHYQKGKNSHGTRKLTLCTYFTTTRQHHDHHHHQNSNKNNNNHHHQNRDGDSSCRMGASCPNVHASLANATVNNDIHINFAYRDLDHVKYSRYTDDTLPLRVAPPNETEPCEELPAHYCLKTAAFLSRGRINSHCAHYYYNRICNRGSGCFFIHAISFDVAINNEDLRKKQREEQAAADENNMTKDNNQEQEEHSDATSEAVITTATAGKKPVFPPFVPKFATSTDAEKDFIRRAWGRTQLFRDHHNHHSSASTPSALYPHHHNNIRYQNHRDQHQQAPTPQPQDKKQNTAHHLHQDNAVVESHVDSPTSPMSDTRCFSSVSTPVTEIANNLHAHQHHHNHNNFVSAFSTAQSNFFSKQLSSGSASCSSSLLPPPPPPLPAHTQNKNPCANNNNNSNNNNNNNPFGLSGSPSSSTSSSPLVAFPAINSPSITVNPIIGIQQGEHNRRQQVSKNHHNNNEKSCSLSFLPQNSGDSGSLSFSHSTNTATSNNNNNHNTNLHQSQHTDRSSRHSASSIRGTPITHHGDNHSNDDDMPTERDDERNTEHTDDDDDEDNEKIVSVNTTPKTALSNVDEKSAGQAVSTPTLDGRKDYYSHQNNTRNNINYHNNVAATTSNKGLAISYEQHMMMMSMFQQQQQQQCVGAANNILPQYNNGNTRGNAQQQSLFINNNNTNNNNNNNNTNYVRSSPTYQDTFAGVGRQQHVGMLQNNGFPVVSNNNNNTHNANFTKVSKKIIHNPYSWTNTTIQIPVVKVKH